MTEPDDGWLIYQGTGVPHGGIRRLPPPPPWRAFGGRGPDYSQPPRGSEVHEASRRFGNPQSYRTPAEAVEIINAALLLRRPLLVTGAPGTGKSTLAYAIAYELRLGRVLYWPVNSRSTLARALYEYDALGRAQEANLPPEGPAVVGAPDAPANDIGGYIRLGPVGTALLPGPMPRVLLIDGLDKGDLDLPGDLLPLMEDGAFAIPELARVASSLPSVQVMTDDPGGLAVLRGGLVRCREFPIVVITSNGDRDFPPDFVRRCVRLEIAKPDRARLSSIVAAHLGADAAAGAEDVVQRFLERGEHGDVAVDQLLNAIYLTSHGVRETQQRARLVDLLLRDARDGRP
ncbi:AAA family ATPase [Actinomadura opuntiae]|uniref:AAA family ATPase n=1 Tax=Actinomadura sp. OS1-43 TaxID=604315 RepID=UPI00255A8B04|nr:AAA family ATPase [Actinomadura sp. OS1-43]MDL4813617.1 AAA family ATPase [Actinomadura sp. OS1-43]